MPERMTPDFAVVAQIAVSDVEQIVAMGFRSLINNRPDDESTPPLPVNGALIALAAQAAGLQYVHVPIPPATQTEADIALMQKALAELPKPVLAFCRSGNRSRRLYLLAQASS